MSESKRLSRWRKAALSLYVLAALSASISSYAWASMRENRATIKAVDTRVADLLEKEEKAMKDELKGDVKASWGDQMRSYVLQPFQMVKDLRTEHESGNTQAVFDGDLDDFIDAGIRWRKNSQKEQFGA